MRGGGRPKKFKDDWASKVLPSYKFVPKVKTSGQNILIVASLKPPFSFLVAELSPEPRHTAERKMEKKKFACVTKVILQRSFSPWTYGKEWPWTR
jgi:hypothetical protein